MVNILCKERQKLGREILENKRKDLLLFVLSKNEYNAHVRGCDHPQCEKKRQNWS